MPFNKEKAIEAAQRFIQKGQVDKAVLEYRKVVESDPEDARHMQKLGELYVRLGSRQEAIAIYLRLAESLVRKGFSNRAISIYKQILQLNPLFIPAYIKLSEIFKTLGLAKDARIFNQRAVEIVQKAGTIEDVHKLLSKIVEIDPDDAISRIALAELCLKMNNTRAAVAQFEAAIPILRAQHLDELFIRAAERLLYNKPDDLALCRELAVLHLKRNEVPKAMKLLLHCRKQSPEDMETLDLLIAHFMAAGNREKAAVVLLEKAKILGNKGDAAGAEIAYRKLLEIDPANEEALRALGLSSAGRVAPARPRQQQPPAVLQPEAAALEERLQDPAALLRESIQRCLMQTETYLQYGLKDKAMELLFAGIEETGGSPELRERIKDLYIDMGDFDSAIDQLFTLVREGKGLDQPRTVRHLKEILLLDPNDARAIRMLHSLGVSVAPPAPAAAIEEPFSEPVYALSKVLAIAKVPPPAPLLPGDKDFLDEETVDGVRPLPSAGLRDLEEPFLDEGRLPSAAPPAPPAPLPPGEEAPAPQTLPPPPALDSIYPAVSVGPPAAASVPPLTAAPPPPVPLDPVYPAVSVGPPKTTIQVSPAAAPPPPLLTPAASPEAQQWSDELDALETETVEEAHAPQAAALADDGPEVIADGESLPAGSFAVESALDEAEFFTGQGLFHEALMLLDDMQRQYPANSLVREKIDDIRCRMPLDAPRPSQRRPLTKPAGEVAASKIADEALEALGAIESIISFPPGAAGPSDEAEASTPSQLELGDAQSHYDIGIAYMEMGLWGQAIPEFRLAANNPSLEATCYSMIGGCYVSSGNYEEAVKEYKLGLFAKDKTQEQELTLYYNIALAYISLADHKEALYYLQNIRKKKPDYRDVAGKIAEVNEAIEKVLASRPPPSQTDEPSQKRRLGGAFATGSFTREEKSASEIEEAFDTLFSDVQRKSTAPGGPKR